jgi:regulator of replication initiation timing
MENIKNLLNEAYEDNSAKQRVIEELKYEIDGMTDENHTQRVLNNHLQFLLDSVMLEFCPDEMTEEQLENWSKHQQKSNLEIL